MLETCEVHAFIIIIIIIITAAVNFIFINH